MYLPPFYFPLGRLVARRRSRCWRCDQTMKRCGRITWWCSTCKHLVNYTYKDR